MDNYDNTYDPLQTPVQSQLEPYSDSSQQLEMPATPAMAAPSGYPAPVPPSQPTTTPQAPGSIQTMGDLFGSSPWQRIAHVVGMTSPYTRPFVEQYAQQRQHEQALALQQQGLQLRKEEAGRQAVQQGYGLLDKAMAIEDPNLRNHYLNSLKPLLGQFTGEKNPLIIEMLQKTDAEQQPQLLQGMKDAFKTMGIDASPEMIAMAMKDHKMRGELFAHIAQHQKLALEQAQTEAFLNPAGKASGGAQVPSGGQPGTSTPGGYLTAPPAPTGALQGQSAALAPEEQTKRSARKQEFENTVDEVGSQMKADPKVIQMVKASAAMETAGYNSQATSPKGARGTMQFMPETATQYGVQNPTDDRQAIAGAIKYYTQLGNMFPGKPELQFASYNAGEGRVQRAGNAVPNIPETQNYVKRGMNLLGGKPVSEAVASGPPEYTQRLTQLNTEIARDQAQLEARAPFVSNPGLKDRYNAMEVALKAKVTERDSLMKQLEPKTIDLPGRAASELGLSPNPSQWNPVQAAAVNQRVIALEADTEQAKAKATEESRVKVSNEQGLAQQQRSLLPNPELYLDENHKGLPGKTTIAGLQELEKTREEKGLPPLRKVTQLDPGTEKTFADMKTAYEASKNILERLKSPEVQRIIGNIISNPEGYLERLKGGKVSGLTEDQVKFQSALAYDLAKLRKGFIGSAQTHTELQTLDPFTPTMSEATPGNIKAKVEALQEGILRSHRADWETYDEMDRKTPKQLPAPTGYTYTPPVTGQSARTTQAAPPPPTTAEGLLQLKSVSPAVQELLNELNGGKK